MSRDWKVRIKRQRKKAYLKRRKKREKAAGLKTVRPTPTPSHTTPA